MLTSRELSEMQTAISSLLPDTCNILSVTRSSDGQGGWSDVWGTATANVSCRLDAYSSRGLSSFQGNEMVAGGAVKPFARWIVTLPSSVTVNTSNRIESGGSTYNIVAVDSGKSWQIETRCIVEKV